MGARMRDETLAPAPAVAPAREGGFHQVSTRELDADEQIELWEHHNARVLFDLGVRSLDDEPLDAASRTLQLPRLTFARVSTNPHILERTEKHCSGNQFEGVMLFFLFDGQSFFHHRQGVHLQHPGTVVMHNTSEPFMRGFVGGLQEYVLTVPRTAYEETIRAEVPKAPVLRSFAERRGHDGHGAELARLMQRSLSGSAPPALGAGPGADLAEIEQDALELFRAMFSVDGSSTSVARRREAMTWIRRNLGDPSLSVTSVAQAIGVSERTLTRAFQETGGSVARTILELRLERAHGMLSDQGAPSVHEVALRCGFVSAPHFSRVFRRRYDAAPGEVRAAGSATA